MYLDLDDDVCVAVDEPTWGLYGHWLDGGDMLVCSDAIIKAFGIRPPTAITDLWWVPTDGGKVEKFEWVDE